MSAAVHELVEEMKSRFNREKAIKENVNANYLFTLTGPDESAWFASIKDGNCEFIQEELLSEEQRNSIGCFITIDSKDLRQILSGRMTAMTASLSGILDIDGDIGQAMQLVPIFFK